MKPWRPLSKFLKTNNGRRIIGHLVNQLKIVLQQCREWNALCLTPGVPPHVRILINPASASGCVRRSQSIKLSHVSWHSKQNHVFNHEELTHLVTNARQSPIRHLPGRKECVLMNWTIVVRAIFTYTGVWKKILCLFSQPDVLCMNFWTVLVAYREGEFWPKLYIMGVFFLNTLNVFLGIPVKVNIAG